MSLDYQQRVDFRAFDVLIDGIRKASLEDLERALVTAKEFSGQDRFIHGNEGVRAGAPIWLDMITVIQNQIERRV